MGLFSSKKMPVGSGFSTMLKNSPPEVKAGIMTNLEKYGQPQALWEQVLAMKPLYATKMAEVYADRQFFAVWQNEGLLSAKPKANFWHVDAISHFFIVSAECDTLMVVFKTGGIYRLPLWTQENELVELMEALQQFIPMFHQNTPVEDEVLFQWGPRSSLVIRPDELVWSTIPDFHTKAKERRIALADVIWCRQSESAEDDGPILSLFMRDGTELWLFQMATHQEAYEVARIIKHHAPHMLYGPVKSYEKLFKKDREKLIALGKAQSTR